MLDDHDGVMNLIIDHRAPWQALDAGVTSVLAEVRLQLFIMNRYMVYLYVILYSMAKTSARS